MSNQEYISFNTIMRKRRALPILENIEITTIAAEGKSLARVEDKVVFVPYVVPGDNVNIQVKRKKHNYILNHIRALTSLPY